MTIPTSNEVVALCSLKTAWADAWVEESLLICETVTNQAAPGHATATFSREYGVGQWRNAIGARLADTGFVVIPKLDIKGQYIRVVTPDWSWYGVVMEQEDTRAGDVDFDAADRATGTQTFVAFGLSILMDKAPAIRETIVVHDATVKRIGRAIPVNGGLDGRESPDRLTVENKAVAGQYFADEKKEDCELWNRAEFTEYLLNNFPLVDKAVAVKIPLAVVGFTYDILPFMKYEGKTLWQLLNELYSRQRGLGFHLSVDTATTPDTIQINIWSYSPVNIVLPGGVTIPANPNQASLNLAAAANVTKEHVSESLAAVYDAVRVIGEYRGSVCSFDENNGMIPGWVTAGETAYNDARSGDAGYSALSTEEKIKRNSDYRASDVMQKVFSWWSIDGNWDRQTPKRDLTEQYVFPGIQADDGEIIFAVADGDAFETFTWVPALRVADFLPMHPGVDYSGTVTPATSSADDTVPDFMKPLVWFEHQQAEQLDAHADSDDVTDPRQWSVAVTVRKDWPGLVFDVSGGQQHFIADDLYTPNGGYEAIRAEDAALDHDVWVATVYLPSQERVVAIYPAVADWPANDAVRIFDVEYPGAHLDVLIPGTVVGIEYIDDGYGGKTVRYQETAGGILRDNRVEMQDRARQTWEWVSVPRRILNIEFTAMNTIIPVGLLYTDIGGGGAAPLTVNSVVTHVQHTLATGTTSFKTQAAELDE